MSAARYRGPAACNCALALARRRARHRPSGPSAWKPKIRPRCRTRARSRAASESRECKLRKCSERARPRPAEFAVSTRASEPASENRQSRPAGCHRGASLLPPAIESRASVAVRPGQVHENEQTRASSTRARRRTHTRAHPLQHNITRRRDFIARPAWCGDAPAGSAEFKFARASRSRAELGGLARLKGTLAGSVDGPDSPADAHDTPARQPRLPVTDTSAPSRL
ncbi:Hypothetical predicted protein [Olea europaea subsp. europaea]|uniref:Uncharacterized protein n=1 Tax=Olea europaea subsp. europaea TaxID=158383 RepID=A0A8S0RB20_OLEEU|nr:Hypothetical predicted protein [Olea europaea subsp. europaea]